MTTYWNKQWQGERDQAWEYADEYGEEEEEEDADDD